MLMPRPCNITRWEPKFAVYVYLFMTQCCCEISWKFLLQMCQEECNFYHLFYFITTQEVNNIISQLSMILENVVIASGRPVGVDEHENKFMLLSFHRRKEKISPLYMCFVSASVFFRDDSILFRFLRFHSWVVCGEERLVIDKWMNGMNCGCSCFIASFL